MKAQPAQKPKLQLPLRHPPVDDEIADRIEKIHREIVESRPTYYLIGDQKIPAIYLSVESISVIMRHLGAMEADTRKRIRDLEEALEAVRG